MQLVKEHLYDGIMPRKYGGAFYRKTIDYAIALKFLEIRQLLDSCFCLVRARGRFDLDCWPTFAEGGIEVSVAQRSPLVWARPASHAFPGQEEVTLRLVATKNITLDAGKESIWLLG